MMDLMIGHWKSQFLACAAKLGIADLLNEKPMTSDELAKKTNCHPYSLYRLLRALESMGIFIENSEHKFELTPLGSTLRTGILRHTVIAIAGDDFELWSSLMHCIQTGESGHKHKYGISYYERLKEMAEKFQNFRLGLFEMTTIWCSNISNYYDFNQFKHIIDCGGNDGTFLITILKNAPKVKGTVYDIEPSIAEANKNIVKHGLTDRMTGIAGSFLESVPEGGDCYIMKSVLNDWNDENAKKMLSNIRKQMTAESKLLLIQSVIPESGGAKHPGKFFDLLFLLCNDGKERTSKQLEQILKTAGMKINQIVPTEYPIYDVIEVVLD